VYPLFFFSHQSFSDNWLGFSPRIGLTSRILMLIVVVQGGFLVFLLL